MPFTGYRLYAGRGGLDSVDFSSPVALVSGEAQISVSDYPFENSSAYTFVLRPVADGIETPDITCRCVFMTDSLGNYLPSVPMRVQDLRLESLYRQTVTLGWSYDGQGAEPAVSEFEIWAGRCADLSDFEKVGQADYTGRGSYSITIDFSHEQFCRFYILVKDEGQNISRRSNILGPVYVDMTAPPSPQAVISKVF